VCNGAHRYNKYLAIQGNHYSWGMCTTSVECKTVIIVMLMVMSGMDPHMISGTFYGLLVKSLVGLC
jgi:hypothetical protein